MHLRKNRRGICLLLTGLFLLVANHVTGATGWEKISDEDGIRVHIKPTDGSPVVSFRGESILNAQVVDATEILLDNARAHEWMPSIAQKRDLKIISPMERIEYSHIKTLWPLTHRYVVSSLKVENLVNDGVKIVLESVEDTVKEQDKVLGILHRSYIKLKPTEDGKMTKIVLEFTSDPGGYVPKWIVNTTQRGWPRHFIQGLQKQIIKLDKESVKSTAQTSN